MHIRQMVTAGFFCCFIKSASIALALENSVQQLSAPAMEQRVAAAEIIKQEREHRINDLIQVARRRTEPLRTRVGDVEVASYHWREDKHLAILLLGDLRASEAIVVLLENIEYMNPRSDVADRLQGPEFWFPAVESLIKIGMPAIDPVVDRLGREDKDGVVRRNCLATVRNILGLELAKTKLQLSIGNASDAAIKKNLSAALAELR